MNCISIPAHGYSIAHNTGVWVSATLLEATTPYAPYPSQLSLVSSTYTGLTQARTGDSNSSDSPSYDTTITDDTLQQTVTTPVYSGISPHDDGTTPPLRNLQLSSGSTHGWQFAPRLGQSVLLTHWYGDIDSPVISRSLYDGIGMGDCDDKDITTRDSGLSDRQNLQGGSSPRWHGSGMGHSQVNDDDSHSGWLSGIAQYGLTPDSEVTLSFDDTPSKVGLQWSVNTGSKANAQSPTRTSSATFAPDEHSLALGLLRHRYSNHQSSDSGQGMNLASDHSVQVNATTGVLLSTFGLSHSQSEHESAWVNDAGQRQLALGSELSSTFSEAKQAHLQSTKEIKRAQASMMAFKTAAQVMDETLNTEVLGAADVLLVSKDSILASSNNTLWTAKTIVRQSGATQSDVVAGSYKLTADKIDTLSGVGGQTAMSGLHMSANREPLAIQAQGGELQLHSQQSMTIGSESGQVNVSSPKRIKLQTSAGASITIDDSGIKLVCPGMIKVQAVKKSLISGARANYSLPMMPKTIPLFSNKLDVYDLFYQHDFNEIEFQILRPDGQLVEGILDEHGRTAPVISDKEEEVEAYIGFKDTDWGLSYISEDKNIVDSENIQSDIVLITIDQMKAIWPNGDSQRMIETLEQLNQNLDVYKLDTTYRKAHFLGQVRKETGLYFKFVENLNYSPKGLEDTFSYFNKNPSKARLYGRIDGVQEAQQVQIANRAYGNRGGNADIESGDGWRYRGRGLKQVTLKSNYKNFTTDYSKVWNDDNPNFEDNPELLEQPKYAVRSAVWYWLHHELYLKADEGITDEAINSITRKINAKTDQDSYAERRQFVRNAYDVINK